MHYVHRHIFFDYRKHPKQITADRTKIYPGTWIEPATSCVCVSAGGSLPAAPHRSSSYDSCSWNYFTLFAFKLYGVIRHVDRWAVVGAMKGEATGLRLLPAGVRGSAADCAEVCLRSRREGDRASVSDSDVLLIKMYARQKNSRTVQKEFYFN